MKKENLFEAIQRYISTKYMPFFVSKNGKEEVFFSKEEEKKLVFIVEKYLNGTATREEIYDSLKLAQRFFMQKHHSSQDLSMPQLYLQALEKDTKGAYYSYINQIGYAEAAMTEIEDIMKKTASRHAKKQAYVSGFLYPMIQAFKTIGHEMTHYKQNSAVQLFEKSSTDYKMDIDEVGRKVLSEYLVKEKISEDELKEIVDFVSQHFGDFQDIEWTEEMYQTISHASYLSLAYEQDARRGGVNFAEEVLIMISQSKYASSQVKAWAKANINSETKNHQWQEENFFKKDYNQLEKFKNHLDVGVKKIISIVEKQEGKNALTKSQISAIAYQRMLVMMVQSKPLEEKKELLKFSMSQGYTQFSEALIESIAIDAKYTEQSSTIQEEIRFMLATGKNMPGSNKEAYEMQLDKLLSNGQIISITDELVKQGKYEESFYIMLKNRHVKYSIEKIYAYAETLEKTVPETEKNKSTYLGDLEAFYAQISIPLTLEEKFTMIQSKRAFEDDAFYSAMLFSIRNGNPTEYLAERDKIENFLGELDARRTAAKAGKDNILFSDYESEYELDKNNTNKEVIYGTHIIQKARTAIGSAVNKKKIVTQQVEQENLIEKQKQ